MTQQLLKAEDRGATNLDWLNSYHSFSFGHYWNPDWMGFRDLRVINDDTIAPHSGFGEHGHQDMEIVTVMISGTLTHRDSLGHSETLTAGEVQRMSAGTGIRHSEMNLGDQPARLLQLWILPDQAGLSPSYEQRAIALTPNQWTLLVSPEASDGSLLIHQNARLSRAVLAQDHVLDLPLPTDRSGWLQVIDGQVQYGDLTLQRGDGLAIGSGQRSTLSAQANADLLLFDLA
jgi:quercetin 2,3-dioxygenase